MGVRGAGRADRVVHQISSYRGCPRPGWGAGNVLANCGAANYAVVNPECGTPR
jgi:hypothetical protein